MDIPLKCADLLPRETVYTQVSSDMLKGSIRPRQTAADDPDIGRTVGDVLQGGNPVSLYDFGVIVQQNDIRFRIRALYCNVGAFGKTEIFTIQNNGKPGPFC